jgi:hypothetical protein
MLQVWLNSVSFGMSGADLPLNSVMAINLK